MTNPISVSAGTLHFLLNGFGQPYPDRWNLRVSRTLYHFYTWTRSEHLNLNLDSPASVVVHSTCAVPIRRLFHLSCTSVHTR